MTQPAFRAGSLWARWFTSMVHLEAGEAEAWAVAENFGIYPEVLEGYLETCAAWGDKELETELEDENDDRRDAWRRYADYLRRHAGLILKPPQLLLTDNRMEDNPYWVTVPLQIWEVWSFTDKSALVTFDARTSFGPCSKIETGDWYPVGIVPRAHLRESLDLLIAHGAWQYYVPTKHCLLCGLPWCEDEERFDVYAGPFDEAPAGEVYELCCGRTKRSSRIFRCGECDEHFFRRNPADKSSNIGRRPRGEDPVCIACVALADR